MIKVKLSVQGRPYPELPADEAQTIKDFLEEQDVDFMAGQTHLDGSVLSAAEMNATFAELGVTDHCYISIVVKAANAAEARLIANSFIVTSAIDYDDLKKIQDVRPKALRLYDEEDKDNLLFAIKVTKDESNPGSLSRNGAVFAKSIGDKATIDMCSDAKSADQVYEQFGAALIYLNKLEEKLGPVIEEINGEIEAVKAAVTVG